MDFVSLPIPCCYLTDLPGFGSSRGSAQQSGEEKDVIGVPRLCSVAHLSGLSATCSSFIQSKDSHYPRPAPEWKTLAHALVP
ncbi:uncharacterized protein CLUP02_05874 [Colletotrichum lupini]|uniref:Uncharacterized protein n=1 Tax=Colletotrichum lupini TaxID=145971 RepID=A0A9Q8WEL4_9PEZI|nr:uncharacterized protein CLUP02_05874 [Colletotrichum lupini]UQC80391.1 hypothetical protein CLUP02_05874 [Colletotrichum lupini]